MRKCNSCNLVKQVMNTEKNNYVYWLATELFVELHDGKDYCDVK